MSLYNFPLSWKYALENTNTLHPSCCGVRIKLLPFFFILNISKLSLSISQTLNIQKKYCENCERENLVVGRLKEPWGGEFYEVLITEKSFVWDLRVLKNLLRTFFKESQSFLAQTEVFVTQVLVWDCLASL